MTISFAPTDDVLRILVEEVWGTYIDSAPLAPATASAHDWTARIGISGEWNGEVFVTVSQPAAAAITTRMTRIAEPTASDISDALGELANIVGGNVKSLMPDECLLSLPDVTHGQVTPATEAQSRLDFMWRDEPITITVHEIASHHPEEPHR